VAVLPIINNVFRCALNWEYNATSVQTATNVIHVKDNAGGHDAVDAYNVINAHVTAGMWGATVDNMGVISVDVTPLDGSSATYSAVTGTPAKWAGAITGEFVPQASAPTSLATANRGRSARGRVYVPGLCEGAQSEGFLTGSIVTSITTAWETFLSALLANTPPWELVVASYKLATAQPVIAVQCRSAIATQRRRQRRNQL
jgi:hypothetical protein